MARITPGPPRTLWYRIGSWVSHCGYGVMLYPGAAIAHNMPVGRSYALFELGGPPASRHAVSRQRTRQPPGPAMAAGLEFRWPRTWS
jgi:hypothetical protein